MAAPPAYTLYYAPKTRSISTRWLLEELGVPYQLHTLDFSKKEHKAADYLKIQPHGQVPALTDHAANVTMYESAAIALYLAAKHNRFQVPVSSPEYAHFLQWCLYGPATIEHSLRSMWQNGPASSLPPAERSQKAYDDAKQQFTTSCAVLSAALQGKPFLVANTFTVADHLVTGFLIWASMMGALKEHPVLEAYIAGMKARPAWQRTHQGEVPS